MIAPPSPTCSAQAGTRLHAFLQQFPNRQAETSICGTTYLDAFAPLGQFVKILLGIPCWETQLLDEDPATPGIQPVCSASHKRLDGTEDLMPLCTDGETELCWHLVEDEEFCAETKLAIEIETHQRSYPVGSIATIECLVAE